MIEPRPELAAVPSCLHGSVADAELAALGLVRSEVIDFSASTNPLGPSPNVLAALRGVDFGRYPDDGAAILRAALAERDGVSAESVAVGNGSVELIWLLALAYLRPGDAVVIVGPTFGEYARAAHIFGAQLIQVSASADRDFAPPLAATSQTIAAAMPRLVFLCNPNNPTGAMVDRDGVRHLLDVGVDSLLVVDEAYLPFCANAPHLVADLGSGRLVLLRSLTKDYGLAGLRLGYALAAPSIVDLLDRVRPPWNVNAPAQAAGLAALADDQHLARAREVVFDARAYLVAELRALGFVVYPPAANFVLVRVGDGRAWRARLLRRGMCVRDCASFGLPDCIRIGVRTRPECRILIETMRAELARQPMPQPKTP